MTSASILSDNGTFKRSRRCVSVIAVAASVFLTPLLGFAGLAQAQAQQKPNIIFIMGDDIGWSNIGVYNQGIMAGRTPNLDRLASEGTRFTDYYAEASCTAGRARPVWQEPSRRPKPIPADAARLR